MPRKTNQNRQWGKVLQKLREEAGLSQDDIGRAIGYSCRHRPSGNVSEIEHGKLPVREETIRVWVAACGKTMSHFYGEALCIETDTPIITTVTLPAVHHPMPISSSGTIQIDNEKIRIVEK